jgi:hypothetical protein
MNKGVQMSLNLSGKEDDSKNSELFFLNKLFSDISFSVSFYFVII